MLGQALLRNTPIFIPDARYSHRFPPDPRWPNTHSRVIVPIRLAGSILGLLDLHSSHATQHTHHELIGLSRWPTSLAWPSATPSCIATRSRPRPWPRRPMC